MEENIQMRPSLPSVRGLQDAGSPLVWRLTAGLQALRGFCYGLVVASQDYCWVLLPAGEQGGTREPLPAATLVTSPSFIWGKNALPGHVFLCPVEMKRLVMHPLS